MDIHFEKNERVELADFKELLPRWIWQAKLASTTGRPLTSVAKVKKYLINADIGITEADFTATVKRHIETIEHQNKVKEDKRTKEERLKQKKRRLGDAVLTGLVLYAVANTIKKEAKQYKKVNKKPVMARWVPSTSDNPSEEHMLNYGKVFDVSIGINGELPQERLNCQCAMVILTEFDNSLYK